MKRLITMAAALTVSMVFADHTYTDPIVVNSDLTLKVADSTVDTYTGEISGSAALHVGKTDDAAIGDGTIAFAHANNPLTGELRYMNSCSIQADASGAFGTGLIRPWGYGTVRFNAQDGIFGNDMGVDGANLSLYFLKNTSLNGKVIFGAEGVMQLAQNGDGSTNDTQVVFNGEVEAKTWLRIYLLPGMVYFNGKLTVAQDFIPGWYWTAGGVMLANPENNFGGQILVWNTKVYCAADNVLNGASLGPRADISGGGFYLNGHTETVMALASDGITSYPTKASTGGFITSETEPATLVVNGRAAGDVDDNYLSIDGKVSLVLDAVEGYKARFVDRANKTDGKIQIRGGTLEMAGTSSFGNLKEIELSSEAELIEGSSEERSLAAVETLKLEGKFTCSPTVPMPFSDGKLTLVVSSETAELTLPKGAVLSVRALIVDGQPVYDTSDVGSWLKQGEIAIHSEPTSDVWTGKGPTASVTDGGNWQSGSTPNLFGGKLTATFSAVDAERSVATVESKVRFAGMTLSAADGFSFEANSENAAITVGEGGVTVAPAAGGAPVYAFNLPMGVAGVQTWDVGEGSVLRIAAGGTENVGSADTVLTKTGAGNLELFGTNVWNGEFLQTAGSLIVSGEVAADGVADKEFRFLSKSALSETLCLSNAIIAKPMNVELYPYSSFASFKIASGTTNRIDGKLRTNNAANQGWTIGAVDYTGAERTELTVAGGMDFGWGWTQRGSGIVRVKEKPWKMYYDAIPTLAYSIGQDGCLSFETAGNELLNFGIDSVGGRIEFTVDEALKDNRRIFLYGSYPAWAHEGVEGGSVIDLKATVQTIGSLYTALEYPCYSMSYVTGDPGSLLKIVAKWPSESQSYAMQMEGVSLRGQLSLYFASDCEPMLMKSVAHTAVGSLEVAKGTMEFAADASWLTATNVVVSGTGRLVLNSAAEDNHQTFDKTADWDFSGTGVVVIPAGVTQKANRVRVEGADIQRGTYDYANAPAALKSHLDPASGGSLYVKGPKGGLIVTVR